MIGVSVIICCFNSALRLPATLKHIALQTGITNISWEVIVVNNNSTDDTKDVAQSEWKKYQCKAEFKIIDELKSGLIHARKAGVNAAQYSYLIFCDDDNWLKDDYISKSYTQISQNQYIGIIGGCGQAVSDIILPDWFVDFENCYAVGKQHSNSGCINNRGYVWGAGLVTRRALLQKVFSDNYPMLLVGRNETKLLAGDDSEICKRVLLFGYDLYYNEELIYQHYIPDSRLQWNYLKMMQEGFKESHIILYKYDFLINELNEYRNNKCKKLLSVIIVILKQLVVNQQIRYKIKLKYQILITLLFNINIVAEDDYRIILDLFIKYK